MFKQHLTAHQIAELADNLVPSAQRSFIRKAFLRQDESHLYPINGRFNATQRAINRLERFERDGLVIDGALEYALELDMQISEIVNHEQ